MLGKYASGRLTAGYLGVMHLLRELVRSLLEAARDPSDIPEGWGVVIKGLGEGAITVMLVEPSGRAVAEVGMQHEGGPWVVATSHASKGWGPLVYDVAMEYATQQGEGLMSDRDSVTPDAQRIWAYYMRQRPDVRAHQLEQGDPASPMSKRYTKQPETIRTLERAGKLRVQV